MLLRILLFFVLAYLLVTALKSLLFGGARVRRGRPAAPSDAEEMVLDPQCQSYVPKGEAIERQGRHFCSQECANRYLSH